MATDSMTAWTGLRSGARGYRVRPAGSRPYPRRVQNLPREDERLNISDQNISDHEMRSITAKTMVIVGDADGVTLEHAVTMFKPLRRPALPRRRRPDRPSPSRGWTSGTRSP